jgi:N-acyl-D-aspartate/D-glutamate deacylase
MMDGHSPQQWDTLIRNGLVFDGTGALPQTEDIAIKDGKIAMRGKNLDPTKASKTVNANGKWVMPGLLDIHTHFDLEVELAPGLPEAVRHGTTTVLVSNCSLGLAFGAQRRNGEDPIIDCFARVENMPKHVLQKTANKVDWDDSAAYLDHLDTLPLGPNIVPMIPHSMLRAEVMGLQQSVSREPTEEELQQMEALLEKGMREGYVGFSTDALPFHYLANDPNRKTKIPSQWGSYTEMKRLTAVLRKWDRLWQATPPKDSPKDIIRNFMLSSGRFFGKPLKITAVAAMDIAANANLIKLASVLTLLINNPIIKGNFKLQALAAPFKVYWDGPINPLAEEIPELRELNEPDLEDRDARMKILRDPDFRERFTKMWMTGKEGFSLARLGRLARRESMAFRRDFAEMYFVSGGPAIWKDDTFEAVFNRLLAWRSDPSQARDEEEAVAFAKFPAEATGEADFMLHLFEEYDMQLRWWVISANQDPEMVRKLLFDEKFLPGFNDSGAHITNMAFYDCNLRGLQLAQEDGLDKVAWHVKRLTRDPAEFIGIDAGRLEQEAQADIIIIDPQALETYDSETNTEFVYRDDFEHEQLVNRSDGVVTHTFIAGGLIWQNGFTEKFGTEKLGRALRHVDHEADAPALMAAE